jgi:N6-L-threonylcarbamoyladenine synthase
LLVGSSFAKGLSVALQKPLIEVNHLQAHILAPFIRKIGEEIRVPRLPYLCLLISGGHTQLVVVKDYLDMETIGSTIDDAAGEAFDKCAKIIGFDYPGGPKIDKYASLGNEHSFSFSKPEVQGLDFSFSGLKTSFLYFIRDQHEKNINFIKENRNDLCASIQYTIIEILMDKLIKAVQSTGIKEIAIAGGVSANKGIRERIIDESKNRNWNVYIPEFSYTTDNAAMIAQTAFFKYQKKQFSSLDIVPKARYNIGTNDVN